jgi:hypothetical protein
MEKWFFSRANFLPTIRSPLIHRAGDVPTAEGFAKGSVGIVTLASRMTRLEGKLNFSQTRSRMDQKQVVETPQHRGESVSRGIGTLKGGRQAARRT